MVGEQEKGIKLLLLTVWLTFLMSLALLQCNADIEIDNQPIDLESLIETTEE